MSKQSLENRAFGIQVSHDQKTVLFLPGSEALFLVDWILFKYPEEDISVRQVVELLDPSLMEDIEDYNFLIPSDPNMKDLFSSDRTEKFKKSFGAEGFQDFLVRFLNLGSNQ